MQTSTTRDHNLQLATSERAWRASSWQQRCYSLPQKFNVGALCLFLLLPLYDYFSTLPYFLQAQIAAMMETMTPTSAQQAQKAARASGMGAWNHSHSL